MSPYLRNFRQKTFNPYLFNFSCPFCGDSEKEKTKARGYLYQKSTILVYKCHNCNISSSFPKLLKKVSQEIYDTYLFENFEGKFSGNKKEKLIDFRVKVDQDKKNDLLIEHCIPLSFCDKTSKVRLYAENRLLDLNRFFYCENLLEFIKEINPKYTDTKVKNGIVIPFYDKNLNLTGIQVRNIDASNKKFRYESYKKPNSDVFIFGLKELDYRLPIFVTEGPFDASFLKNSVAVASSNLKIVSKVLGKDFDYVFIFDNEPRNQQIITGMLSVINSGYKILIYPENIKIKDINDMVINKIDIKNLMSNYVYSGLEAQLAIQKWKKI